MIFGIMGRALIAQTKEKISQWIDSVNLEQGRYFETEELLCYFDSKIFNPGGKGNSSWSTLNNSRGLILDGQLYNEQEFLSAGARHIPIAQYLWQSYKKQNLDFLKELNGDFSMLFWDELGGKAALVRDKIGVSQIYYGLHKDGIVFGSNLKPVVWILGKEGQINRSVLLKYLTFCYNPGLDTFYEGIYRLRPGFVLEWKDNKHVLQQYWKLSFDINSRYEIDALSEEIRNRLTLAVEKRIEPTSKTGAFLSGGLDSSTIVSLLHRQGKKEISTFSFRCRGESFDESHYAKIVADFFGIEHEVIEYSPEDAILAEEMVSLMDEPFSDVGINVATYLLAKAAKGRIEDLFTGDGGDELFAGHPVYLADKIARFFDAIPKPIREPIFYLGRLLPDSEKKKDWKVKIKRFSESYSFPKSLGTHRWRVYYHPEELRELVNPELSHEVNLEKLYNDVISINQEARGYDPLSKSLYSDYQTVVQFYLRRMEMVRSFGLRPKFPMLDPDVVAFCATIPSSLKIKGFSDVKYIERVAVEPLLPYEIVHRKDKLGHSIPLKNWMRENKIVHDFVMDILSEETLKRRGFFNPDYINEMISQHMNRSRNHSHRLWALVIFELWQRSETKNIKILS